VLIALVGLATSALADSTGQQRVKIVETADVEDVDLEEVNVALTDQEKEEDLKQKVRTLFEEKFGTAWHKARECAIDEEDEWWNEDELWIQKKWL
jgi:hypothetical protein